MHVQTQTTNQIKIVKLLYVISLVKKFKGIAINDKASCSTENYQLNMAIEIMTNHLFMFDIWIYCKYGTWAKIVTHVASITTPTPAGWIASVMATAICLVRRSCTEKEKGVKINIAPPNPDYILDTRCVLF